jgi:hypothetical protein
MTEDVATPVAAEVGGLQPAQPPPPAEPSTGGGLRIEVDPAGVALVIGPAGAAPHVALLRMEQRRGGEGSVWDPAAQAHQRAGVSLTKEQAEQLRAELVRLLELAGP